MSRAWWWTGLPRVVDALFLEDLVGRVQKVEDLRHADVRHGLIKISLISTGVRPTLASISPGETGTFANFWQARSSCHRAFCSISISPMFRCLCWGQVLSKHLRSAVAAPSSISSSSCSVSILASSGSQRLETDAIPCTQTTGSSVSGGAWYDVYLIVSRKLAFRQTANPTTGSRGGTALRQPLEFPWCEAKFAFCLCIGSSTQTG